MAKKISELTAITTIADNDLTPIVDTSETETKKMTALQIKNYAQGDLNTRLTTLTTYSTVEQKTGEKWIDGKDIYRTVATGTFASDLNFHAVVTNVSTFIDVSGTAQNRPFTYFLTTANDAGTIDIVNNNGTLSFRLRSTNDLGNKVFSLILRYTKTS